MLFVAWLGSTYVGFAFGDALHAVDGLGLDFAIYATLVALAAPSIGEARSVTVGLAAGLVALLLAPLPYQVGVLIAVVIGTGVGVLYEHWFPQRCRKGRDAEASNDDTGSGDPGPRR